KMGVDVLIVVDVSAPLLKRDKLSSAPVISNQMLAILIQRNTREQLATLSPNDILVRPPLGESSAFDFGVMSRQIATGVIGAQEAQSKLAALSVSSGDFDRQRRKLRSEEHTSELQS